MAITNYAIIDHVGSLTSSQNLDLYSKIYVRAESEGFEKKRTCVTLKTVCLADSPYARKVSDKMKHRARCVKNPKKVYFICNKLNSKSEAEARKWCKRNIPVEMYDVEADEIYEYDRHMMCASPYPEFEASTNALALDDEASVDRRIADIWKIAIEFPFSAPVTRELHGRPMETQPDRFLKHPKYDELVASGETHVTNKLTSSGAMIGLNLSIAPESECKEYRTTLDFYASLADGHIVREVGADFGAFKGNHEKFKEFFAINVDICECGRPYKLGFKETYCTCGRVHKSPYEIGTYYEDNGDDNDSDDE